MDSMGLWFSIWFFRTIVIPGAVTDYASSILVEGRGVDMDALLRSSSSELMQANDVLQFRFIKYCSEQIEKRIRKGKDASPDITGYLVDAYENSENKKDALSYIHGDSRLIIVAGSDTSASTLSYVFYHLASHPGVLKKLRQEVEPMMEADGGVSHVKVQKAQYLNGCINEALRLNPPVPAGVFRKTPREGVHIGGTLIAGNIII